MNVFLMILLAVGNGQAKSPGISATHCDSSEQVFFECEISKTYKTLSVCGSAKMDSKVGYLQYRFGRLHSIEMTFPESRSRSQEQFRWTQNLHPDIADTWLTFKHKNFSYSIFSIRDNSGNHVSFRRGVIVSGTNGLSQTQKCSETAVDRLGTLGEYIKEGDLEDN